MRLVTRLVKPLATPGHAVWLLPAPEFRRAAPDSRGTLWEFPRRTNDPETGLRNLLERDRLFTIRLGEEVRRLKLPAIEIRTGMSVDELTRRVMEAFGL